MVSASNAQKTHLARTLNQFAERKAAEAIQLTGRALPCSVTAVAGSIVTVKFEVDASPFTLPNVTVPMATPEYVRWPVQVGDKGVVLSADTSLATLSGLGAGTPDLALRANLSCLLFIPVSSKSWSTTDDPDALVLYGPDGGVLRSVDKTAVLRVTKAENSWLAPADAPATIKGKLIVEGDLQIRGVIRAEDGSTYVGNITTTGDVIAKFGAAQVGLSTHTHAQAADSHGDAEADTHSPTGGT